MEYSLITQDLAYLERDGFGPLDHSSVLELEDRFGPPTVAQPVLNLEDRLGLRPRPDDPVSVSMSLRKGVPRPNILLPNSTCFAGGLLISTDVGASFGLDTALSGAVAAHLSVGFDEMQILLGMPACREETAAAWIDFGASSFLCVDAVSLEGPGDPEVLQPGLRFSSAKMFQDYFTARTVLDIPLPERLGLVTADFPSIIGLGHKCYLREDVAAAVDDGRLIGVELGRVSFRAELINGRS